MPEVTPEPRTVSRKDDHIRINLEKDVQFRGLTTGLERYRFRHTALPELDLADVSIATRLFNKPLAAPILISSMTGGTDRANEINRTLAQAAQAANVAMGLGSMRAALERPDTAHTFQVRGLAPDILLFANLGAVQFNYGYTADHCRRVVDLAQADALVLHFNAVQEAVQPEGNTNFAGLLKKVEAVCKSLNGIPIIAKEVGWGFSKEDCRRLAEAGISAIDVAGAGGTSWSQVEMYRAENDFDAQVAAAFVAWGIPTAEAIRHAREAAPQIPTIASGGLRDGIDIAKCLALGATLGGLAGPFLKAADTSGDAVIQTIYELAREIRIVLFATGCKDLAELQSKPVLFRID
ncbi:MAG TPA: type 2 isopentenyl-diphosphate Delta-isomerase [Anaerolineales bacterium]|nr:type 2 isopentenyl-diphosphate Delta-isomerase [Anaerolineales bacterium]